MYKRMTIMILVSCIISLAGSTAMVNADPDMDRSEEIETGVTHEGDKFFAGKSLENRGTIRGDLFSWSKELNSPGTVVGDIIGGSSNFNVPGTVDGSIMGGGEFVKITGTVTGNVRIIGNDVTIGGTVKRNVIACGQTVTIDSSIDRSLIACGRDVIIGGKVRGKTRIFSPDVILKGNFSGDVLINDIDFDVGEDEIELEDNEIKLTVLPGTIIRGTLKFKGTHADIQEGAKVGDFQWTKPDKLVKKSSRGKAGDYIWKFIKSFLVATILFLIGLLIYKISPETFSRMGDIARRRTGSSLGIGLVSIVSIVPALLVFIILLAFSVLISPAFGLIFGLTTTGLYVLLFYFAVVPVGIWLGNLIMKDKSNVYMRYFLGLIVISVVLYVFNALGDLKIADPLFSTLSFLINFFIVLMGSGVIIIAIRDRIRMRKSAA